MNQLSIIQALTGVIPGQGTNGNGGQGTSQSDSGNPGAGLFGDLLGQALSQALGRTFGQQLSGAALKLQQGQQGEPGFTVEFAVEPALGGAEQGSPDGASALLQLTAGEAGDISASIESTVNVEGVVNIETADRQIETANGQVLFGLINHAANNAAIENSPVLAAALAEDGDTETFAAGPNEQMIPGPFLGLSPAPAETSSAAPEGAVAPLPTQADAKAGAASGKEHVSTAAPASVPAAAPASAEVIEIALAVAPSGAEVSAAAKSLGPAEAPAVPQSIVTRSDIAPVDAQKALKVESDTQSRSQVASKILGQAQANIESDVDDSGGFARDGNQNGNQGENVGSKNPAALLQASSATGSGVKTSLEGDPAATNTLPQAQSGLPAPGLPSHLTPLRALENSMALQAGLALPFDGAPIDPMSGMQTSASAQSLAAGIQALQAGTAISSPATSAASFANFAHAPNFVAHQVGLQITRAVADGLNEFTIRLNPPEMGRIEVRLEFQADGGIRAALSAERPETLHLLQRDAAALERTLNEAGIRADADSLNFSLQQGEAQAGDDDTNGTGKSARAGEKFEDDDLPTGEIEITEQVLQQMVADGAVDIHV